MPERESNEVLVERVRGRLPSRHPQHPPGTCHFGMCGVHEAFTELASRLEAAEQREANLIAVVEAAEELKLWEPGRKGWAAVHRRLNDALAALDEQLGER